MNPPPNFNATAPNDVKDFATNLWHAVNIYLMQRNLSLLLTPSDYDHQDDLGCFSSKNAFSRKVHEINIH